MRWLAKRRDDWSVGFAVLPVTIGDDVVWLERYLYKFCGEYTAVELYSKERPRSMTERETALFDAAWNLVTAIRGGGPLPHKAPIDVAAEVQPLLTELLSARNAATLAEANRR